MNNSITPQTTPGQFTVGDDGYLRFEGLTINDWIASKLTQSGIFTDQNYQGSNLTAIHQTFSYILSMILMYVNEMSCEGSFSEAQLAKNVNRIVKTIGYNPIGYQCSTLSFTMSVVDLVKGIYTIPRYSSVNAGGITFSFNEDISFVKTTDNESETLTTLSNENLLFQGKWREYPLIRAQGIPNEIILLPSDEETQIDNFNIHVYVKDANTQTWTQWQRTQSLFLHTGRQNVFTVRFNHHNGYEIQFGNDINGSIVTSESDVAIYYLNVDVNSDVVGANSIDGKNVSLFNTPQLEQIISDVVIDNASRLTNNQLNQSILLSNKYSASYGALPESIDSIKLNAPGNYKSQLRLVRTSDYEHFVRSNYANVIQDVVVYNNDQYLENVMQYYSLQGVFQPHIASRPLAHQVLMSSSCNFNNIYVILASKVAKRNGVSNFVGNSLRNSIIKSIQPLGMATAQPIIVDPVYVACDIGVGNVLGSKSNITQSKLRIYRQPTSKIDKNKIKQQVYDIFAKYFDYYSLKLGQTIDCANLGASILSISGVQKIQTVNSDISLDGVCLTIWNETFSESDVTQTTSTLHLPSFKMPYWYDFNTLLQKIEVI